MNVSELSGLWIKIANANEITSVQKSMLKLWPFIFKTFISLIFQIQNANDVLIAPLEKFRKEQIGAAKVSFL